jgi:hypothetical protein
VIVTSSKVQRGYGRSACESCENIYKFLQARLKVSCVTMFMCNADTYQSITMIIVSQKERRSFEEEIFAPHFQDMWKIYNAGVSTSRYEPPYL